jgi:hypothetical protein
MKMKKLIKMNNILLIMVITFIRLKKILNNKLICKTKKRLLLMIKIVPIYKFRCNFRKNSHKMKGRLANSKLMNFKQEELILLAKNNIKSIN